MRITRYKWRLKKSMVKISNGFSTCISSPWWVPSLVLVIPVSLTLFESPLHSFTLHTSCSFSFFFEHFFHFYCLAISYIDMMHLVIVTHSSFLNNTPVPKETILGSCLLTLPSFCVWPTPSLVRVTSWAQGGGYSAEQGKLICCCSTGENDRLAHNDH